LLGESLRQHLLNYGIQDTVKGLQATGVAMTTALGIWAICPIHWERSLKSKPRATD
jgi:hypothetical protein